MITFVTLRALQVPNNVLKTIKVVTINVSLRKYGATEFPKLFDHDRSALYKKLLTREVTLN